MSPFRPMNPLRPMSPLRPSDPLSTGRSLSRLLDGRVVLVTGGSRGVGAAAAEVLGRAGARIAVAARSESDLLITADAVRRHGAEVVAIPVDVTDPADVQTLVRRTEQQLGPIDVLINAAGRLGPIGVPLWESDLQEWEATIAADVLGVLNTCHAVVRRMVPRGSGRILNMSSPAAITPIRHLGAYCVSKAAVVQLTQVLAADLDGTGVTAHSFQLGPTDSPVYRQVCAELWPDLPVGRSGSDRDLFDACLLLVLLSVENLPPTVGDAVSWRDPWVRRGMRVLQGEPWTSGVS